MTRLQDSAPQSAGASRQDSAYEASPSESEASQNSCPAVDPCSGIPSTDPDGHAVESPIAQSTEPVGKTQTYLDSATDLELSARPPEREFPSIPGYEILGVLGRGGMGRVYKSRHLNLNRLVALKVILDDDDADLERVARFRAEAKAIARLQHPNIVQIYEVGEHNSYPYLCLELVEGGSLKEHMRGTPMSGLRAARLVETLARAVHAAHQQGVIHRDLKPANILMAPPDFMTAHPGALEGWVPKITDFGLAKKSDESVGLTMTGAVMGTPRYMAPEQAAGRSREIGPASDTYALGVILYELLTGRTPFQGTTMEVLDQVRHAEPLPPRRIEPEIPTSLETICLKCLEREPSKRYSSAAALAADLRRFQESKPILARPIGPVGHIVLWSRRNRWPLAAAVAMVAAVLITWFGASFWQSRVREERDRDRLAKEREWKEYQETRSKELFEKILTDGPSSWPPPPEELLVFQNGLHDLQVRKNRAGLQGDEAESKAIDVQLKRAEPLLSRLQADLSRGELMGLQVPAVESARSAAKRAMSNNNLKQLGLAAHNFQSATGFFPQHAIFSKDGKPLLSWRVAILPYLQQTTLFSKFKLAEPWDSPHNLALLKYMPLVYMPPEDKPGSVPYTTFYQCFVGTKSRVGPAFEPDPAFRLRYGGCPDGTPGTLLFVEAGVAVPWTKPEDIPFDADKPLPQLGGIFSDGTVAGFLDGSVRFLTRDLDEELVRGLITRNGGELIEWTKLRGN
jgi:serine/threonine protein kinase